jgi:hypothetical protein
LGEQAGGQDLGRNSLVAIYAREKSSIKDDTTIHPSLDPETSEA